MEKKEKKPFDLFFEILIYRTLILGMVITSGYHSIFDLVLCLFHFIFLFVLVSFYYFKGKHIYMKYMIVPFGLIDVI